MEVRISQEIVNKIKELDDIERLEEIEAQKRVEAKVNEIVNEFLDNVMLFFQ